VFQKVIQANGEKRDANIVNLFCFTLKNAISEWGENLCSLTQIAFFWNWKLPSVSNIAPFKMMNKFTWLLKSLNRAVMKRLSCTMNESSYLPTTFSIRRTIAC